MSEKPIFKNAKELSDYLEELYKDANMMEDDQRILMYERIGIQTAERMADPEFRREWDEKNQEGAQKRVDSVEWQKSQKIAGQKRSDSAEWRASQKAGCQKNTDSDQWKENQKVGAQKRLNSAKWRENVTIANQKKADSAEWRENHQLGREKMKANVEWREKVCKPISCDGVIYSSKTEAAFALAPATRLTNDSKQSWFGAQMKKYPERYFYITEES
jgi:hypothetical protein